MTVNSVGASGARAIVSAAQEIMPGMLASAKADGKDRA
jgi:acetyl-CoA acetyltransferase